MLRCEPADIPIEMNHKLCEDMDQEPTNKEQYQRLVGRLIYLAHTRPNIAYAVKKHVEVDRHFIKEKIEKKIIRLPFVKSEDQLADVLTKAVCSRVFHDSLTKLGIGDVYAPT
ncbi:unnamed protein product [Prunus brigantina]